MQLKMLIKELLAKVIFRGGEAGPGERLRGRPDPPIVPGQGRRKGPLVLPRRVRADGRGITGVPLFGVSGALSRELARIPHQAGSPTS